MNRYPSGYDNFSLRARSMFGFRVWQSNKAAKTPLYKRIVNSANPIQITLTDNSGKNAPAAQQPVATSYCSSY